MEPFGAGGRQQGLSSLEVALVVIVVGLLIMVAVEKILRLEEEAERVSMQYVLSGMKRVMAYEFARLVVQGERERLPGLEGRNPLLYFAEPPENYLGELDAAETSGLPAASWYYSPAEEAVVYLVRNSARFVSALPGPKRARFRVVMDFEDANGNGIYDASEPVSGLRVRPLEPYRWLDD